MTGRHQGVLVGYLHGREVSSSFHRSFQDLVLWDATHRQVMQFHMAVKAEAMGIPDARNMLASELLSSPCEWLLMVDADMGFTGDSLDRLLEVAHPDTHPIVGGLCFVQRETVEDGMSGWRWLPVPTIYQWQTHPNGKTGFTPRVHYPIDQVVRCHATGGAFVLIHRTVFERLADEWGPHWFDRTAGPDGAMMGEDLSFFVRVMAAEFPVHVHTGVTTTHQKTVWVSEVDFWQSFYPPPATGTVEVLYNGDRDPELETSLRATTGLAVDYAPDWIFACDARARFRPGWLDHAQFTARLYDAKVVRCGRFHLVDADWHAEHPDWLEKAQVEGVFQVAAGSVVEG